MEGSNFGDYVSLYKAELNPKDTKFNLSNALFLANASDLAYQSQDIISAVVQKQWGYDKPQFFYDPITNTLSFLTQNADAIVLVFRGTLMSSIRDWMTDGKVLLVSSPTKGKIHFGFNEALSNVWGNFSQTIAALKNSNKSIWLTGHSLGGALALLAADRFTESGVSIQAVYNFGQPMVGDSDLINNYNSKMGSNTFRFVDDRDEVPKLPWRIFDYRHSEKIYFFDNQGALYTDEVAKQRFISSCQDVAVRTSEEMRDEDVAQPGAICDHDMGYYCRYVHQNLIKQTGVQTFLDYANDA